MKKLSAILFLCVSMILTACGAAPANAPQPTMAQSTDAQPVALALTETLTPIPTDTLPAATATQQPSRTPSAPETCPQVNEKIRAQFGSAFKGKKDAYHDVRQVVLDFLNEGGNPQTAIAKLAENGVTASVRDVTADGVPEFLLPSGYYSIFGCHDGKYQTLLDIAPTENTGYEPVALVIDDLNKDGIAEILLAQVLDYRVKYSLLAWDGTKLSPLTPENHSGGNVYIENHDIYAVGQSHAEAGKINGNWQVDDINGDGIKEISIKAGVNVSFFSPNLEERMTLSWDGGLYGVASRSIEATPTNTPTTTPLPFSKTCDYKAPEVQYQNRDGYDDLETIKEFLNTGGDPQKLHDSFAVTVQDLTNDSVPEIILVTPKRIISFLYIFSCINGHYEESLEYQNSSTAIQILAIKDLNKNTLPEIILRGTGCFANRCGSLFIGEWDGDKFAGLIKDKYGDDTIDYADLSFPQDAYLKDLDGDGISELVWVGAKPDEYADQSGLPWRVETHTYKWDGKYYAPQLVEYSQPVYRFQAVQDGDHYALHSQLEKALDSYRQAISNENLGWWSEDREKYLLNQAGFITCGENKQCPQPEQDLDEQYVLKAYATYRIMLTQILLNQPDQAANTYNSLINEYPLGAAATILVGHEPKVAGSIISEMATDFWKEYQASKNITHACADAIMYAERHKNLLRYIGSDYHGWQMDNYKPVDICPFKQP